MATKVKETSELDQVRDQRASLAGRAERLRAQLVSLPSREERARREALESGEDSWTSIKTLFQERSEIEAELESIGHDQDSLAVRQRELEEAEAQGRAEALDAQADAIRVKQAERLGRVGEHVAAIAEAYAGIVQGEEELAALRQEISATLQRSNHSLAQPEVSPLASSPGDFLDQVAFIATETAARGGYDGSPQEKRPSVSNALLDAIPDYRSGERTYVEGVRPHYRILATL